MPMVLGAPRERVRLCCQRVALSIAYLSVLTCGSNDSMTGPTPTVFSTVSAGVGSACGLTSAGAAYCWGSNTSGQLGAGVSSGPEQCSGKPCTTVPVRVAGNLSFATVSAGENLACGVTASGTGYCWGDNTVGEIGDSTSSGPDMCSIPNPCSVAPVTITGSHVFKTVSAGGNFACGVTTSGTVYCWGWNVVGELGLGSTTGPQACGANPSCSTYPRHTLGGLTLASISAGGLSVCGLAASGAAYCWGEGRGGQLGDSTASSDSTPVAVVGGHAFTTISTGGVSVCGLTATGTAYCWGENTQGELGDSTITGPELCGGQPCSTVPVAVVGGLTFEAITVGNRYACGVASGGDAYCWGVNSVGQLGDGSSSNRSTPTKVAGPYKFATISAGNSSTCGVTINQVTYCWGLNSFGELGNGTTARDSVPVRMEQ
jgi:alpha-tubulin suppressor-like RCC1 family protein